MPRKALDVRKIWCYSRHVTVPEEEKYDWVVMFRKTERKLYTYMNRSVDFMTNAIQKSYERSGSYPYRVWVIVDGEIQKVEIL